MLGDFKGKHTDTVELKVDNQSALVLSKNHVFYERSKQIDMCYHFIKECLDNMSVNADFIGTMDQLVDILTQALGRVCFQELRARLEWSKLNLSKHTRLRGSNVSVILVCSLIFLLSVL